MIFTVYIFTEQAITIYTHPYTPTPTQGNTRIRMNHSPIDHSHSHTHKQTNKQTNNETNTNTTSTTNMLAYSVSHACSEDSNT